jgi:hypothetical protein
MRERSYGIVAWVSFALLVGYGAYLMLAACDLGIRPLFGLQYCRANAHSDGLSSERARERGLRDRIHEAELRVARLPACAPPPPPVPEQRAEPVPQPPQPEPPPKPEPPPQPEQLKIPENLSELKGCWQSVRGDLPRVSDDAEQRPVGNVRICYCIGDNGRGAARYIWTDGGRCIGPLRARLSGGKLVMNHGRIGCNRNHGYAVGTQITCSSEGEGNSATCDEKGEGSNPGGYTGEKYQRVTEEHCR